MDRLANMRLIKCQATRTRLKIDFYLSKKVVDARECRTSRSSARRQSFRHRWMRRCRRPGNKLFFRNTLRAEGRRLYQIFPSRLSFPASPFLLSWRAQTSSLFLHFPYCASSLAATAIPAEIYRLSIPSIIGATRNRLRYTRNTCGIFI